MMKLQRILHIIAFLLFIFEVGRYSLTNAVPTAFAMAMCCFAGALWVVSSYIETFHIKS